jgi:hypothetical protein
MYSPPPAVAALEGCGINLAHAGVQATDHALRAARLRQGHQSADSHERQAGGKSQALGNAARDAQAGERAGTGAKGNRVAGGQRDARLTSSASSMGRSVRVALDSVFFTCHHSRPARVRQSTIRRRLERRMFR